MKHKKIEKKPYKKYLTFIVCITASLQVFVPMITGYVNVLEKCFEKQYHPVAINNIFNVFEVISKYKMSVLIYAVIALIFSFTIYDIYFTKKQLKKEKEGVKFKKKDGTHGTANFTTPQEIDILKIGNEENTNGILIGKTLDTDEIIILPDEYNTINRNVMIWGASGSGKSSSFIIPNTLKITDQEKKIEELKNLALQGKNVVCTDPKAELYSTTNQAFREAGYDVKVFNLVSPSHSDGIDLIRRFIEKELDAQVFAEVVINTT